jgi:hypothetical protein
MYENYYFAKELRFYSNHKSEIGKNILPPRLPTMANIN